MVRIKICLDHIKSILCFRFSIDPKTTKQFEPPPKSWTMLPTNPFFATVQKCDFNPITFKHIDCIHFS